MSPQRPTVSWTSAVLYTVCTLAALGAAIFFTRYQPPAPDVPRPVIVVAPLALDPDAARATLPWPAGERDDYLAQQNRFGYVRPKITTSKAMIVGVTDPFAVHAGLDVLKRGGNAVDAALTTSLAQIALNAGAAVSYAGMLTAVYYEAATGKVHSLNAAFNTVKNETMPMTIPRIGEPSGRTALVPGFMAGVQALHDRFGKLPFATLFEPSIWIADHGVALSPHVAAWLKGHARHATRLPEGKRIFTRADGSPYERGDLFRQPELAHTLRKVAANGADYMYKGEWARRCAALVQREGGKMTVDDLANYKAIWSEPARITYRDYEVVSLGAPNFGGATSLGALKMAELADLKRFGHPTDSADALYRLIQIARAATRVGKDPSTSASLLKPQTAQRLWEEIERGNESASSAPGPAPSHSSGVVVVDEHGNVLSLLHSINTILWGTTGIFVDGVSIPDPAAHQQKPIAEAGRGRRLPEGTNPLLVLRQGRPVLASMAIGSALHPATLHRVINVLEFGMDPQSSVDQPSPHGPFLGRPDGSSQPEYALETIGEGEFSVAVLDGIRARGQPLRVVPSPGQMGYWIGIQIDREKGQLRGGVSRKLNGIVEGY